MQPRMCMIVLACGLIIAGCGAKDDEQATSLQRSGGDVGSNDDGSVAAKVNGTVITRGEVNRAVKALAERLGGQVPPEQMANLKQILWKQTLESLINQQILAQEADREGIKPDEKKIDAQMKEIAGRLPDAESFKKLLASMGISEKQLRQDIGQNIKIEALLDKKVPQKQKASDKEIEAFYKENIAEFKTPERVKASHILIKVEPGDSAQERAKKKQKIAELRERIAKGEDFAKLASENSECPSKAQGGDLGFFAKGSMVKPFEDAAFGMKAGQLSDVVETEFGYHLIKVTGHEDENLQPLEKVRDKVAEFMNQQKKQGAINDYLKTLRTSAKIEYAEGAQPATKN